MSCTFMMLYITTVVLCTYSPGGTLVTDEALESI